VIGVGQAFSGNLWLLGFMVFAGFRGLWVIFGDLQIFGDFRCFWGVLGVFSVFWVFFVGFFAVFGVGII